MKYNEFQEQYTKNRNRLKNAYSSHTVDFIKDIDHAESVWTKLRNKKKDMLMYGHTSENSEVFREVERKIEESYNLLLLHYTWRKMLDSEMQCILEERTQLFSLFKYTNDIYEYYTYPEVYKQYSYECYMHWHGTNCGIAVIASSTHGYGVLMSNDFNPSMVSTYLPIFAKNMLRFEPDKDGVILVFPVENQSNNTDAYQLVYFEDEVSWGIQIISTEEILVKDTNLLSVLNDLSKRVNQ